MQEIPLNMSIYFSYLYYFDTHLLIEKLSEGLIVVIVISSIVFIGSIIICFRCFCIKDEIP